MPRWPTVGPVVPPLVSPWWMWPLSQLNISNTSNGSATWPTANRAFFYPVLVPDVCLITHLWWQNGTTAAGNIDCGIYDDQANLLVSTGSTAQSGINASQEVNVTDTVLLGPAVFYFALVASSTSSTFFMVGAGANIGGSGTGWSVYTQSSALPLPAPATFATPAAVSVVLPKFGARVFPRSVL